MSGGIKMISYEPFRILKAINNITLQELIDAGINSKTAVKLNSDESMTTNSLNKVLDYLSRRLNREVKIEEIIKYVHDTEE